MSPAPQARTVGALFVLFLSASLAGAQPPPRDSSEQAQPATAVIRGRVLAGDTGRPLRRARVSAYVDDIARATLTDAEGRYEFRNMPAGRYAIDVSKNLYLRMTFGQTRPGGRLTPLEVAVGQLVEKVDVTLPRASVITGRVVDEIGDPVANAQVSPMRYQFTQTGRALEHVGRPAATNDIGEFRVFGLVPGDYYLSTAFAEPGEPLDDRSGYAPTYFPGTPVSDLAQKITVGLSQTVENVVITLTPTRLARISGMAVDSRGRPFDGNATLSQIGGRMVSGMNGGRVAADGTFSIDRVPPGSYRVQARGIGADAEVAKADVLVTGEDLTDVHLMGMKPVTLSGRIVIDPDAIDSFRRSSYRVLLSTIPFEFMPNGLPFGPLNEDLTFSIKVLPGRVKIQLAAYPGETSPAGVTFVQRAIYVGGTDVIDTGVDVNPNQNVEDVRIEITNRLTSLSGVVSDSRGASVRDAFVIVFPRDRERWTIGRYSRLTRPSEEGRYKVSALPPGDYEVAVVSEIEEGQNMDPDFLEGIAGRARSITIAEGETKTLDLEIRN